LKQAPSIIVFALIGAGSFTPIIMLTAEFKLEHDLLASNWNYKQIYVFQENAKFSSILNGIEKPTT